MGLLAVSSRGRALPPPPCPPASRTCWSGFGLVLRRQGPPLLRARHVSRVPSAAGMHSLIGGWKVGDARLRADGDAEIAPDADLGEFIVPSCARCGGILKVRRGEGQLTSARSCCTDGAPGRGGQARPDPARPDHPGCGRRSSTSLALATADGDGWE